MIRWLPEDSFAYMITSFDPARIAYGKCFAALLA